MTCGACAVAGIVDRDEDEVREATWVAGSNRFQGSAVTRTPTSIERPPQLTWAWT